MPTSRVFRTIWSGRSNCHAAAALIIVDNVIRDGALIDAKSEDPNVQGARRMHEMLAAEPRVSATTIQTVGSKGYDGFTLALVTMDVT